MSRALDLGLRPATRSPAWSRERRGTIVLCAALALLAASIEPTRSVVGPRPALGTKRPNILLLTVDCLRADRLGCYGYGRPTSPALDALAREGVLFEDFIGQSGWTSPGLTTILTGLYPEVTGIRGREDIPHPGLPALPAILGAVGYEVPNLSYLTSLQNYWNLGYGPPKEDLFRSEEDRHLVDFLERPHPRPFFAWYHYRFLHLPYNPGEPWSSQLVRGPWPQDPRSRERLEMIRKNVLLPRGSVELTPEEQVLVGDLYDANVRRMDAFVSSILSALDHTGLTSSTVVAVTADHGEELFERGFVGHASTNFDGTLHGEIVRVPLVIRAPGIFPAGKRVRGLSGQIDVAPTLAELAHVAPPRNSFQGASLVPLVLGERSETHDILFSSSNLAGYQTAPDKEQLGYLAATTKRWRYIRPNGTGPGELYDRVADPGEKHPVTDSAVQKALEAQLTAHELECHRRAEALVRVAGESPTAVTSAGPAPRIVEPRPSELTWEATGGSIEVGLESAGEGPFLAQYDVGSGVYHTAGTIVLVLKRSRFGPFSRELWKTLALWNPFRFRVSLKTAKPEWSEWREFKVDP